MQTIFIPASALAFAALITAAVFCAIRSPAPAPPPATGALIVQPDIPAPKSGPHFDQDDAVKLHMNASSYLYGSQETPEAAALSGSNQERMFVGMGKQLRGDNGSQITGELSIGAPPLADNHQIKPITRLSAAYLKQINSKTDFRADLVTDLDKENAWSTLELHFNWRLRDGLSLELNHGSGQSLNGDGRTHKTDLALEKRF